MGHIHLTDTIETVFATLVNIQIGIASYSNLYTHLSISEKDQRIEVKLKSDRTRFRA
jgi:hypothetical protein